MESTPNTLTKTRFAPSPTGQLHLGNVRTALYSALFAWQQSGHFLLRFEDTDLERSKQEYADAIMHDLQWLGLSWNEGPVNSGNEEPVNICDKGAIGQSDENTINNGPYYQSQRTDLYDNYYQQLQDQGDAYPCFCSSQQLALTRKSQLSAGQPPRYPGTCSRLSADEVHAKLAQGLKPTLRFKVGEGHNVAFKDGLKGKQDFRRKDIGDFIIRRADGSTAFFFSNAIDDAVMGVTHVVRGEDHITNTPRQMMILQALGLRVPDYAHTPMLLGDDGTLLSKRHGSFSVKEMREQGYLPEAIINYLGRIGQAVNHDECLPAPQLAQHFILSKMSKSSARFDSAQLLFWQKQAVSRLSVAQAMQWSGLEAAFFNDNLEQRTRFFNVILPNVSFAREIREWAETLFQPLTTASEAAQTVLKDTSPEFYLAACDGLEAVGGDYKSLAKTLKEKTGQKGKQLFMPLRAALTGRLDGPAIPDLLTLLGSDTALHRFKHYTKLMAC